LNWIHLAPDSILNGMVFTLHKSKKFLNQQLFNEDPYHEIMLFPFILHIFSCNQWLMLDHKVCLCPFLLYSELTTENWEGSIKPCRHKYFRHSKTHSGGGKKRERETIPYNYKEHICHHKPASVPSSAVLLSHTLISLLLSWSLDDQMTHLNEWRGSEILSAFYMILQPSFILIRIDWSWERQSIVQVLHCSEA
jgi:hypothetical protein